MKLDFNIYFFCFVALFIIRNATESFVKPKKEKKYEAKRKGAISLMLFVISHMVSGVAVGFYLLINSKVNLYLYLAGISAFLLAFLGRISTLRRIGDSYTLFIEPVPGGPLVTSGIYSIIRHPIYALFALEMVGFVIIRFNYVSLAALIIDLIATLYRVREEEILLRDRFSEEFVNYKKRTKKLIPFVY